jgi:hypothetical protein
LTDYNTSDLLPVDHVLERDARFAESGLIALRRVDAAKPNSDFAGIRASCD